MVMTVIVRARGDIGRFSHLVAEGLRRKGVPVRLTRPHAAGPAHGSKAPSFILDLSLPRSIPEAFLWARGATPARRGLVVLEPAISAPILRLAWFRRQFGIAFAPSSHWSAELDAARIPWPYAPRIGTGQETLASPREHPREDLGITSTMILASKRSAIAGEGYSLRRNLVDELDRAGITLAVAGPGWLDSRGAQWLEGVRACIKALASGSLPKVGPAFRMVGLRPRNYLGVPLSKEEVFALARTTLVVENSDDYVSEKILDALAAGVAPILVRPSPPLQDLPANVVLWVSTPAEATRLLRSLSHDQIGETIQRGAQWLSSEGGPLTWEESAVEIIVNGVVSQL